MKKVACFFADGSEEVELLAVVDVLRRGGVRADLISISGDLPVSAHQVAIKADLELANARMADYDAIYIPGGLKGAKSLAAHQGVIQAIQEFNEQKKVIAAICAGPTVLEQAGVLKGRQGTSYPGFEKELSLAEYKDDLVVVSDHIVTSRGPATALILGFELLRQLGLGKEADRIWDDMLMNQLEDHFSKAQSRHVKGTDDE